MLGIIDECYWTILIGFPYSFEGTFFTYFNVLGRACLLRFVAVKMQVRLNVYLFMTLHD